MNFKEHRKILNGAKSTVADNEKCYAMAITRGAAPATLSVYAECCNAAYEDLRRVRSTPLSAIATREAGLCLS